MTAKMENQPTNIRTAFAPATLAALGVLVSALSVGLFVGSSDLGTILGIVLVPVSAMMMLTATIRGALYGWFQGRR